MRVGASRGAAQGAQRGRARGGGGGIVYVSILPIIYSEMCEKPKAKPIRVSGLAVGAYHSTRPLQNSRYLISSTRS